MDTPGARGCFLVIGRLRCRCGLSGKARRESEVLLSESAGTIVSNNEVFRNGLPPGAVFGGGSKREFRTEPGENDRANVPDPERGEGKSVSGNFHARSLDQKIIFSPGKGKSP